jgi:hypothetical protein
MSTCVASTQGWYEFSRWPIRSDATYLARPRGFRAQIQGGGRASLPLGLGRLVEAKRSAEDVNASKIQRLALSQGPIIGAGRKQRRDEEFALI